MALQMPEVSGHPNRMPFSGVLTRLDTPSDRPRRLQRQEGDPHEVRRRARAPEPDRHGRRLHPNLRRARRHPQDRRHHRRHASKATPSSGWHHLRPGLSRRKPRASRPTRRSSASPGSSPTSTSNAWTADPLVITDAYFTGAAILRKDKAAYQSTSLAASAGGSRHDQGRNRGCGGERSPPALKPLTTPWPPWPPPQEAQAEALAALQASAAEAADEAAKAAAGSQGRAELAEP
jgi:hypothetical protein